jgi:hypothetical protein
MTESDSDRSARTLRSSILPDSASVELWSFSTVRVAHDGKGHQPNPGSYVDPNAFQSPISATSAAATTGPMRGISSSHQLASHERCQAGILLSIYPISLPMALYCSASTAAGRWRDATIRAVRNDLTQISRCVAPFRKRDAELGQMPAYGITQRTGVASTQPIAPS